MLLFHDDTKMDLKKIYFVRTLILLPIIGFSIGLFWTQYRSEGSIYYVMIMWWTVAASLMVDFCGGKFCLGQESLTKSLRSKSKYLDDYTYWLYLLTILTDSMEQSPSWEVDRFSASQEIPRISWNPKVHTAFTSARHLSLPYWWLYCRKLKINSVIIKIKLCSRSMSLDRII
jgi:hypothetical protein